MNDMMQMWGLFALLTVLAALFVVMPFFRRDKLVAVDHDANAERIDIYQQRLQELADELANQRIDQSSHDESVLEMKRRLLNELSPERTLDTRGNNLVLAGTGVAFLLVVSAVFYSFTGSQKQIADWYKAIDMLPEYGQRAVMQTGDPLSPNELQAFALGLRTKLANSGDDAVAWMLLGRVAMSLNDFEMAMQAFDKALEMQPNNSNVKVSYAQALLVEGSENAMNRAARMLSQVLQREPRNIDAISLLALIAYERQDWKESKAAFEVLLASMTQDDPRYAMIKQRITDLDQKLSTAQVAQPAMPENGLQVSVSLANELADKIPENATLFVFAKAAQGPPMPLAVAKLTDFNLPLSVNLDDSMAMMPNLKLSGFKEVVVTARISVDGNVALQSGELEGATQTITMTPEAQQVSVTISRVITSTGS